MATDFIHIATGVLPDSTGELFAHPADGSVILVTNIIVINQSANPNQSVALYIDRGGGDQEFFHAVLESNHTRSEWSGQLTLNNGNSISGVATDASSVNYFIDGVQITT